MYNILLSGVGGQGTIHASKLIAASALTNGETVHTAETIGMAQRGGCVQSHVRIGKGVFSPMIPKGTADMIIAFEPAEAVRMIAYLKKDGIVVTSTVAVKPVTDMFAPNPYDANEMLDYLKAKKINVVALNADLIFQALGNVRSLNVALLGAAVSNFDIGITTENIANAIINTTKAQFHAQNLKALEIGATQSYKL